MKTKNGDMLNRLSFYSKHINYAPCYDKWCLTWGQKGIKKNDVRDVSLFFCDSKCQKKAWCIHKNHCKINLSNNCINCWKDINS